MTSKPHFRGKLELPLDALILAVEDCSPPPDLLDDDCEVHLDGQLMLTEHIAKLPDGTPSQVLDAAKLLRKGVPRHATLLRLGNSFVSEFNNINHLRKGNHLLTLLLLDSILKNPIRRNELLVARESLFKIPDPLFTVESHTIVSSTSWT
jgi:hypothetical protein